MRIERSNNPKQAHRYNVKLDCLPRTLRRFLVENRSLERWKGNMQFMEQILRIQQKELKLKNTVLRDKFYFDWTNSTPVKMEDLIDSYNTVDWFCAISRKPIKAKFNNFQLENFIHPEYSDVLESPMVDSRILKSSIEFRKYCKKLLLEDQKEFIRIVKKGKRD
tara:strand:- start:255 stop:746 length:492 start_codon:yes stop_codon:yes gene_type:complete